MPEPDDSTSPNGDVRTLILLRHGKSDYPGGTRDYDRPLADRGEAEAAAAGRWLRANQPAIDAVICSAALRTRLTLAATGVVAPTRYAEEIYDASPSEVLVEVQRTDPAAQTLLVVGHAPGLPGLAMRLVDDDSVESAAQELGSKFPTSAMAVFTVACSWADLTAGGATLVAFHIARVPESEQS